VTLTGTVPAGITIDWYSGSCGTLAGTGSPLVVTPAATTTYFARARNTSTRRGQHRVASTTVTVTGSAAAAPTGAGLAASDWTLCFSSTTVTFAASAGASS
jgi:hypothetical protein